MSLSSPRIIALDCETVPDMDAVARLAANPPEFEAPSGYKDQAKIAAAIEAKREKWYRDIVEKAALSPRTGQVVSVALWGGPDCEDNGCGSLRDDPEEAGLLRMVANILHDYDVVLTFNGYSFDGPFLTLRMLHLGIRPPANLFARRYSYRPLCDLRMYLTNWDPYAPGKLDDWCAFLGVPCPGKDMGIRGDQVAELAEQGRWDEIEAYNLGDAQAVWEMWTRSLAHVLGPQVGMDTGRLARLAEAASSEAANVAPAHNTPLLAAAAGGGAQ